MNIVHVVIGGQVAGGQLVALRLARAARDRGHNVSFVSPSDGPFLRLVAGEEMATRVVPISGALDMIAITRLIRTLRKASADVVHTHGHFSVNVAARIAARLAGARVVAHMHIENAFRAGGLGRIAQVGLDNATARLCTWIVAVSEATRASLIRQGYPASRTVTIHNGVEESTPAAASLTELGYDDSRSLLLEIGRLCDAKGQQHLIQALARLPGDVVLLLAGEDLETNGAYLARLEQEAQALGVSERVRFLGYRSDVPALLAAADIVVLPSLVEGLPLVLLEAMAQGKPVVATSVGGTPELVSHRDTGLLVPPGDVSALADALEALLADPDLAARLGTAARRRVREDFSAAAAAERVLELYGADGGARKAD